MALVAAVPERLGPYEPLVELASGGMGNVYVARRVGAGGFEHLVVLKRMRQDLLEDRKFYEMLRDEARVSSAIRHPNAVPVVDVIEDEGELVLVMEYVESCSLDVVLQAARSKGRRLPIGIASRVAYDMLSGLHAAHEAVDGQGHRLEIVHRDVSPQNVLVGVDGSSRMIDFGVAKARGRLVSTQGGESLKGKYAYMSPEQARREPIDRRADVFAAGVVLWEALTCERLFRGRDDLETIERVTSGAPAPAPSTVADGLSPELDEVLRKALAPAAADRYETALDFLEDLERAAPPSPPRQVASFLDDLCGQRIADTRRRVRSAGERAPAQGRKPRSRPAMDAAPDAGRAIDLAEAPKRRKYSIDLPDVSASERPAAARASRSSMARVAPLVFAALALVVVGILFAREAIAYARYRAFAAWTPATCVIAKVRQDEGEKVMTVSIADKRARHEVEVRDSDVERPSACFGGADPEPATFSRVEGGEVHCFVDPGGGVALRRWSSFSLVPLLLLGVGVAASGAMLAWARRRAR